MNTTPRIKVSRFAVYTLAATLANVAIFFIGQASGATYDVKAPILVNVGIVIGGTVIQLAVGLALAAGIARRVPRFLSTLIWIGFFFAVASAPAGWIASGDATTGIALGLMHFTAAFAWLYATKRD